jgi:hypothetical protein
MTTTLDGKIKARLPGQAVRHSRTRLGSVSSNDPVTNFEEVLNVEAY